jgi:hypothetical protein
MLSQKKLKAPAYGHRVPDGRAGHVDEFKTFEDEDENEEDLSFEI